MFQKTGRASSILALQRRAACRMMHPFPERRMRHEAEAASGAGRADPAQTRIAAVGKPRQ